MLQKQQGAIPLKTFMYYLKTTVTPSRLEKIYIEKGKWATEALNESIDLFLNIYSC
jgi:hypothetical protein